MALRVTQAGVQLLKSPVIPPAPAPEVKVKSQAAVSISIALK